MAPMPKMPFKPRSWSSFAGRRRLCPVSWWATWLYGVAYRTALEARGKNARRRANEKQVTEMPHSLVQPDPVAQEWQPLLDQELSRLPAKYRVPVVLCELEGRSRKEVARQLKLPEGTLSSRLATARKMLAQRLTRRGLALSGAALSGAALSAVLAPTVVTAAVPAPLLAATVQAATIVAAGQTPISGVVSAQVIALTEGVLKSMYLTKLKLATAVFVAVTLLGAGLGGPVSLPLAGRTGRGQRSRHAPEAPGLGSACAGARCPLGRRPLPRNQAEGGHGLDAHPLGRDLAASAACQ